MNLKARLARLESKAEPGVAYHGAQVIIVDPDDGRKTDCAYDHTASTHLVIWHDHRNPLDLKVWGDADYAIDLNADDKTAQAQIARQRAHLGFLPLIAP